MPGEARLRRLLAVAVAGGGLAFGFPAALADGLFRAATDAEQGIVPGDAIAAERGDIQALRTAFLIVDPNYLRSHLAPSDTVGKSGGERTAVASRLVPELKMQLFPDVLLEFERSGVLASSDRADMFSWSGWTKRPRACDIEIAIQSEVLSAESYCPDTNRAYFLDRVKGDLYRVIEATMPQVPDDGDDTFNPAAEAN